MGAAPCWPLFRGRTNDGLHNRTVSSPRIAVQARSSEVMQRVVAAFGNWLNMVERSSETRELFFAVVTLVAVSLKDLEPVF